jgi:hypothetical protein
LEGLEIYPRAMYIADMTGETPRRLKRPRDANQLAKLIVDIATGQVEDREPTLDGRVKAPASVSADKKRVEPKKSRSRRQSSPGSPN